MIYLRKYTKRRGKTRFILAILAIIVFVEIGFLTSNVLKSNSVDNADYSNIVNDTANYIVGVSKDDIKLTDKTSSWGSGIIISKKGYILTNAHVCGSKNSFCYIIQDTTNYYRGEVIWSNTDIDMAIIKVDKKFENCINIGNSEELKLGQDVYTIGNPINTSFQKSVGKGIISGLNRSLEFEENNTKFYMTNLIQTDAAINYGSSGGALIDEYGNLVGVNTIKISDAELMGFAIPINIVKPIIKKIEEQGSFEEASLKIWAYDKYSIKETNLNINIDKGIYVAQVDVDSNTEKAGVRTGDIITFIDTQEVNTVDKLKEYIYSKNIGDNVILKIHRNNKDYLVNFRLDKI